MQFVCDHRLFLLLYFVLHTANGVDASRLSYNNLINKTRDCFGILVCTDKHWRSLGKSARALSLSFFRSRLGGLHVCNFISSICQAISSIAFITASLYLSPTDWTDACALHLLHRKERKRRQKSKGKRLQSKRTVVGLKANHCALVFESLSPIDVTLFELPLSRNYRTKYKYKPHAWMIWRVLNRG